MTSSPVQRLAHHMVSLATEARLLGHIRLSEILLKESITLYEEENDIESVFEVRGILAVTS